MSTPARFRDEVVDGPDGIRLRPLTTDDAAAVVEACTDTITQQWLPLPRPYTPQHALTFITRTAPQEASTGRGLVRAIELGGQLAGVIDLKNVSWAARTVEIGYWVHPRHRGHGVAGRAARLLATWAMTRNGFERVEVRIAPGNTASLASAEKVGFVREGVLRNAGCTHGGRVDLVVLSLVRADIAWERDEPTHS